MDKHSLNAWWNYCAAVMARDAAQFDLEQKYAEYFAQRILYLCHTGK
ncbi:MAG: hypothetical protein ACXV8O_05015 [Methylobacter sp.]